jgi:hypothetical protein
MVPVRCHLLIGPPAGGNRLEIGRLAWAAKIVIRGTASSEMMK